MNHSLVLPEIFFMGVLNAGKMLQHPVFRWSLQYVISIGDETDDLPEGYESSTASKLRLVFDDIEFERLSAGYVGCTTTDISRLIEFCQGIREQPGTTLVHCAAGISRSAACVLVLLAVLLGPHQEKDAVAHLIRIQQESTEHGFRYKTDVIFPNRRIISLADQHLGLEGRLLEAMTSAFPRKGSSFD